MIKRLTIAALVAAAWLSVPLAAIAQEDPPTPPDPPTDNAATNPPDNSGTPPAQQPTTPPVAQLDSPSLVASGSILATLSANPHFTILVRALDQAQLSAVINNTPGLTLFAPTDDAFQALPPGLLAKLLTDDQVPILQKTVSTP